MERLFKIKYRFLIVFSLFIASNVVFGHGNEVHHDSLETTPEPSKIALNQVNEAYLKDIKGIFSEKCLTCHGVNNSLPWYYSIPGIKNLMDHDMKEAKEHMDMSNDFPFGGHGTPIDDLNALKNSIYKGDMPPFQYKMIHWKSGLTKKEIKTIKDWIAQSIKLITEENQRKK